MNDKNMKTILIFVTLIGAVFADLAQFTKCKESSDDVCEVTEVRITPCKLDGKFCALKKAEVASIQFDFIPKFEATSLISSLYWAALKKDVPFGEFSNVDICPYTACPTRSGQTQTFAYSMRINETLPDIKCTFKWKLLLQDSGLPSLGIKFRYLRYS